MAQVRDDKLIRKIAISLKELREDKGTSQEEVYNDINVHIGRIESGKANPTVSTISILCRYYKIKLSDFYKMVEALK